MPRVETKSNSDYIDTLIAPYIAIPNVTSPNMKRFIYKSVPHKDKLGRTPLDICSILDPVQSLQCEMLLMTDTHCHFGNSSTYYSANLPPVGASWDVYIKPGRPIEEGTAKKVKCLFFQLSRPARQRKFSRPKWFQAMTWLGVAGTNMCTELILALMWTRMCALLCVLMTFPIQMIWIAISLFMSPTNATWAVWTQLQTLFRV